MHAVVGIDLSHLWLPVPRTACFNLKRGYKHGNTNNNNSLVSSFCLLIATERERGCSGLINYVGAGTEM